MKVKEAKRWKQMVYGALIGHMPSQPFSHAAITMTRGSSIEPDFDGLVSSFKHILDGLKEAKVIVDDKMSVIGQPKYIWERTPRKLGFVRVRVEGEENG